MAYVRKDLNRILARRRGVQERVSAVAAGVEARAAANASTHRDTGEYSGNFKTRKVSGGLDREVYNDHPAAAIIEYGHFPATTNGTVGKWVPGQFNLTRAARER